MDAGTSSLVPVRPRTRVSFSSFLPAPPSTCVPSPPRPFMLPPSTPRTPPMLRTTLTVNCALKPTRARSSPQAHACTLTCDRHLPPRFHICSSPSSARPPATLSPLAHLLNPTQAPRIDPFDRRHSRGPASSSFQPHMRSSLQPLPMSLNLPLSSHAHVGAHSASTPILSREKCKAQLEIRLKATPVRFRRSRVPRWRNRTV